MTSDERREVAAKLREFADTNVWASKMISVWEKFGDTDRLSADILADLIDPTCEVESVDSSGGLLAYRLSCGHTAYRPAYVQGPPPVCPTCGARVVTDDGE